jgi:hypothetical protein
MTTNHGPDGFSPELSPDSFGGTDEGSHLMSNISAQSILNTRPAATALVATLCACCSLPLVDALSVERGIGPVCWGKHGAKKPTSPALWPEVSVALDELEAHTPGHLSALFLVVRESAAREAQQDTANALIRLIAIEQHGQCVNLYTNALESLGYTKLAARIAKRLATVRIEMVQLPGHQDNPHVEGYAVQSPYEGGEPLRFVPGRRWDKVRKANMFPVSSKRALFEALRRCYPGATAHGPKGLFKL